MCKFQPVAVVIDAIVGAIHESPANKLRGKLLDFRCFKWMIALWQYDFDEQNQAGDS